MNKNVQMLEEKIKHLESTIERYNKRVIVVEEQLFDLKREIYVIKKDSEPKNECEYGLTREEHLYIKNDCECNNNYYVQFLNEWVVITLKCERKIFGKVIVVDTAGLLLHGDCKYHEVQYSSIKGIQIN